MYRFSFSPPFLFTSFYLLHHARHYIDISHWKYNVHLHFLFVSDISLPTLFSLLTLSYLSFLI